MYVLVVHCPLGAIRPNGLTCDDLANELRTADKGNFEAISGNLSAIILYPYKNLKIKEGNL
jgi:hypothetical protein